MKSKADLKREFKERKLVAGVFQVRNKVNGKIFLGSSLNLEGVWNGLKFKLDVGNWRNQELQREWKEFGAEAFEFELLEQIEDSSNPEADLQACEQLWLEELKPVGERGYNHDGKMRVR